MVAIIGLGSLTVTTGAQSATLSYPWAKMPCSVKPYAVTGPCPGYAWGKTPASIFRWESKGAGYAYRNCTDYVAWKLSTLSVPQSKYSNLHNGGQWATNAAANKLAADARPVVGSVAVRESTSTDRFGHVAFVEKVSDGKITVSDYNVKKTGEGSTRTGTPKELKFTKFVHFERYMYVGQIVRWKDGTSWLVKNDFKRHWIPNGGVYNCLKAKGARVYNLSAPQLDAIPDAGLAWAKCK